jgi:cysteine sulfinate desulfinase/cysteine desulfurase-like protein
MRVKIPGWAQAVTRLGVVQVEHKCVLDSCRVLQGEGFEVTYLPVGKNGLLNVEDVRAAIRPDTVPPSPDRPAVNEL